MKVVAALALLCFAAVAMGEECRSTSDCDHVTCPENDYMLECHNRQCTCTHTSAKCNMASDCNGNDCRVTWHCVDNQCRCGFGFGGSFGGK